jgi:hypothetical protein
MDGSAAAGGQRGGESSAAAETSFLADPEYVRYYYANRNINPRLPPPSSGDTGGGDSFGWDPAPRVPAASFGEVRVCCASRRGIGQSHGLHQGVRGGRGASWLGAGPKPGEIACTRQPEERSPLPSLAPQVASPDQAALNLMQFTSQLAGIRWCASSTDPPHPDTDTTPASVLTSLPTASLTYITSVDAGRQAGRQAVT